MGVEFADEQAEALRACLTSKMTIITGGPGTGKTSILHALVDILQAKKVRISLASPTGRAAQRLTETTGQKAQTIHRLLQFDPAEGRFMANEDKPLACDFLIVDEVSMLDNWLAAALFRAVPSTAHVVLVGDANQLPSVGAGNVLKDLIQCGLLRVIKLTKIFRQHEQSGIIAAAPAGAVAPVAAALPSVPKMILSKVFLSVLLSKFVMTLAFSIVTSAPLTTGVLLTAAHVSPSLVLRRR
jgi:exodeoxyribonuclease V alpha subunit